jgi:hypothetical protein
MDKNITSNISLNDKDSIEKIEPIDMDKKIDDEKSKLENSIKTSYNINKEDSSFFSKINKKISVIYDDLLTGGKEDMEGVLKFDHRKGAFYIETETDNIYLFTLKNYRINLIT